MKPVRRRSDGDSRGGAALTDASPTALPPILDEIPDELKELPQWVWWQHEWKQDRDEWAKVPHDPKTGYGAKADEPSTWGTFADAVTCFRESDAAGVGFEFSADDPYTGIDFDDCRNPQTGELAPSIQKWVDAFNTYTEVSPSQTGIKLLIKGTKAGSRCRDANQGVEIYSHGRYFTLTGHRVDGTPATIEARQEQLDALYAEVFGQQPKLPPASTTSSAPKPPPPKPQTADDDLIMIAHSASNGAQFNKLWTGDTGSHGSRSEADLALCNMLAFYTGGDSVRVDSLFRRSGLMRAKWDEKRGEQTYGQMTIAKAIAGTTEFYSGKCESSSKAEPAARPLPKGRTLADVLSGIKERVRDGRPIIRTIQTGWALIDETVGGLVRGEFTGIVGGPGSGKTTLADQIVTGALRADPDLSGLIINLETSEDVRVARLVAAAAVEVGEHGNLRNGIPVGAMLRGTLRDHARERALEQMGGFEDIAERLRFNDAAVSAGDIARLIQEDRPDVVLIDHLGLVLSSDDGGEVGRQDSALGCIIAAMRAAGSAGIIINEVHKAALKEGAANMSASRGTARFASLAATFIGLNRVPPEPPDTDPKVVATVVKSRFGENDKMQAARFFGGLSYFAWGKVTGTDVDAESEQ